MSKDVDLSDNVDEVKDQIREAENPDFEALLEEEKSGKDRKTIKEFLQKRADSQEEEVTEAEDEVVEQIEEETEGGLLGGLSSDKVLGAGLAAGLVLGLIFGVAVGYTTGGPDAEISPQQAGDRAEEFFGQVLDRQPEEATEQRAKLEDIELLSVDRENSLYLVQSNLTQSYVQGNETLQRQGTQRFYMTLDGSLLFQERQSRLGPSSYIRINLEEELSSDQESQQPTQEELPEDLQEELENQTQ